MVYKPVLHPGDQHLVLNGTHDVKNEQPSPAKLYDHNGKQIWRGECLVQGINGPSYKVQGGDTVPGLYLCRYVVRTQPEEDLDTWAAYGEWFIGLGGGPDFPDPQAQYGRAGEGLHGGGSALGIRYSDRLLPLAQRTLALAPRQPRKATKGCGRFWNLDMDWLGPRVLNMLHAGRRMFCSVAQEQQ